MGAIPEVERVERISENEAKLWHLSLRLWIWRYQPHLRRRWWEKRTLDTSKYLLESFEWHSGTSVKK